MRSPLLVLALTLTACGPGDSTDASFTDATDRAASDALVATDGSDAFGVDAATTTDATDASARDDGIRGDAQANATVLRVHYPANGHALSVRGSAGPLNWNTGVPMTAGADGVFTFSTTTVDAPIEWKPLVDDTTWSHGPNYHASPGQTVDVYPHFYADHGRVFQLFPAFHSNTLNNDRPVWAYVPPAYDENTLASFPVIYMHDGQNLFDANLAFGGIEWSVDESLDAASETLVLSDSIREAIVIGPDNTSNRIWEYTPTPDSSVNDGGGGDQYLQMLVQELKPQVDAMLRTRPGREDTALMGSSLGGLISAYGGLTHADTYGLIGALSPSTWWDNEVLIADVQARGGLTPRALKVYLDSGDSGDSSDDVTQTTDLANTYQSVGYVPGVDLLHVVQQGATHSEYYWAQRFPGACRFLLGVRPD